MVANLRKEAVKSQSVAIPIDDTQQVSGLLDVPAQPKACCVVAHGAGAGMTHPFMAAIASGLADRGLASLRYQFPYMEHRAKRPDAPKIAQAAVRAAVQEASRLLPEVPIFAGGKSFGGRMTSQAQAGAPMNGVRGLFFFGFPLHPPRRPSVERAGHLSNVNVPMLFLQGTRDEFAALELLRPVAEQLGRRATLRLFEGADHSFHVLARSGRTDLEVRTELLGVLTDWIASGLS